MENGLGRSAESTLSDRPVVARGQRRDPSDRQGDMWRLGKGTQKRKAALTTPPFSC